MLSDFYEIFKICDKFYVASFIKKWLIQELYGLKLGVAFFPDFQRP